MTDRKTVMSWLEGLSMDDWRQYHSDSEVQEIAKAALSLLWEQEPVEPIKEPLAGSGYAIWQCGNCKAWLRITDRFCGRCGKAVKLDE